MSISDLTTKAVESILDFFQVKDTDTGEFFVATEQDVLDTYRLTPLPATLEIDYTGKLPFAFPPLAVSSAIGFVLPAAAPGDQIITQVDGVSVINSIAFNDDLNMLLTLAFPDLGALPTGSISFTGGANLTSFSAPLLTYCGGQVSFSGPAITTFDLPLLRIVGTNFTLNGMPLLTAINLPSLETVLGSFGIGQLGVMTSVTSLSIPNLKRIGGTFQVSGLNAAFTSFSAPSVIYFGGNLTLLNNPGLATVSCPKVILYDANLSFQTGNGNLASVVLGTPGTLQKITGSTLNISGQKLDAASVNGILALLVSLDGTNGTTLWGTGQTVNLSGGTSAAPSGQGITDKATLVGRGATVTTN